MGLPAQLVAHTLKRFSLAVSYVNEISLLFFVVVFFRFFLRSLKNITMHKICRYSIKLKKQTNRRDVRSRERTREKEREREIERERGREGGEREGGRGRERL